MKLLQKATALKLSVFILNLLLLSACGNNPTTKPLPITECISVSATELSCVYIDGSVQRVPLKAGFKCFVFDEYQARLKQIEIIMDAYDRLRSRCNTKELDKEVKKLGRKP